MNKDKEASQFVTASDGDDVPRHARRSRRRHLAMLFGGTAIIATTAVLTALEPKLPPYMGD